VRESFRQRCHVARCRLVLLVALVAGAPVRGQIDLFLVPDSPSNPIICTSCTSGAGGPGSGGGAGSGALSQSLPAPSVAGLDDGVFPPKPAAPCGCCGTGGPCVPGRMPCHPCDFGDSYAARFCCALYSCICCPDPCYEGRWYPLADSAFFCESVRPVVQTKLRYDGGVGFILPDRNEYFWARADGNGSGPKPTAPFKGETGLRHNDLIMITEGGTAAASLTVETPYRNLQAEQFGHASGFSDMSIMTKTLLFDCELLQFALLFRTYIPIGQASKGLGVGHVSLEPGAVVGIKLTQTTYLQSQVSEWVPIGGDPSYSGLILHYHLSVNQLLYRILPDVPIIGTLEYVGYSFQDGQYTDPVLGTQNSSGYSYAYGGGGVRMFVCDKIDFGVGALFAMSRKHFDRDLYRMEFRVRW